MGAFNCRLDDVTHVKLKHISDTQSRSLNKQVEFVVKQFIENYEKVNGKIEIEECEYSSTGLKIKKRS